MSGKSAFYPFELVVSGTPISLQAKGKSLETWKQHVKATARRKFTETNEIGYLEDQPVAVTIYYFPLYPMVGDIDNIVKPIMDSLTTFAYLDDKAVERVLVQTIGPDFEVVFTQPSEQLVRAMDTEKPVVYVCVEDDQSWRVI
jgi:hypothetical protein